jgi:hypothetical protein
VTIKYVERIVEDECVEIDGHRFLPTIPVRDGRKYWFAVFSDGTGIYSVMGLRQGHTTWNEWLKDLREECSLGHVES